jgi:class 3 adenylate cyclase/sugar lactone lactonase YvrE
MEKARDRRLASLPGGTVTFLLTDVEGSTRRWQENPEAMRIALARHDELLTEGIESHAGAVLKERGEGDSFFAVFARASDAVAAAAAIQQALHIEEWPMGLALRVRMAIHTGEAAEELGDYRGAVVNRCARLRALAQGGQILLSSSVRELAQDSLPKRLSLKDLGLRPLRDLDRPERIYQVLDAELPRWESAGRHPWIQRWRWAVGLAAAVVLGTGIVFIQSKNQHPTGPIITTVVSLLAPTGVAVGSRGDLYVIAGNRVHRVDSKGGIAPFAGTGSWGLLGDGAAATQAQLALGAASVPATDAQALAVDRDGNVYLADSGNNRVRKIDLGGTIRTVAGIDPSGFSGDGGAATLAALFAPRGLALDANGTLYIADTGNHRVRRVEAGGGIITTVAGTGSAGYAGDGGRAVDALLDIPLGLAVDRGSLYNADSGNHRIRMVTPSGMISTVAGTGEAGYFGDGGKATAAKFVHPVALAVDGKGNLYIADSGNHRVRKVDAGLTISTFAGTGGLGYKGDAGPASVARLFAPQGVAVDAAGTLYIADTGNARIRRVH